jgi:NADH-ubiquinone oxidoreductase chain 5
MGFVFISSLVILFSDDYMFRDLNIVRFIMLVLMFVVSIMFLIISPNIIRILLGWDGSNAPDIRKKHCFFCRSPGFVRLPF